MGVVLLGAVCVRTWAEGKSNRSLVLRRRRGWTSCPGHRLPGERVEPACPGCDGVSRDHMPIAHRALLYHAMLWPTARQEQEMSPLSKHRKHQIARPILVLLPCIAIARTMQCECPAFALLFAAVAVLMT
jgi:hypothetical protein